MLSEQEIFDLICTGDISSENLWRCIDSAVKRTESHIYAESLESRARIREGEYRLDDHAEGNYLQWAFTLMTIASNREHERIPVRNKVSWLFNQYADCPIKSVEDAIENTYGENPKSPNFGHSMSEYMKAYAISVFFENLRREIHAYRQGTQIPKWPTMSDDFC